MHCMQIILKSRLQFQIVSALGYEKCFVSKEYYNIQTSQESKIFKSNVTTIKIKCSNNFLPRSSVEITYTSLE